jgi:outer membrane lipoprotein
MRIRLLCLLGAALLIQGCSYAISSSLVAKADRSIPFEKLDADPQSYAGKIVILGGVIVQAQNVRNGTLIAIDQKELDFWGKPRRTDHSGGRFLVLHHAYLDPMVYASGREITVAGEVSANEQRGLGDDTSTYLLLLSREMKLWPIERLTSDKPQWLDPLYDPRSSQGRYGY